MGMRMKVRERERERPLTEGSGKPIKKRTSKLRRPNSFQSSRDDG